MWLIIWLYLIQAYYITDQGDSRENLLKLEISRPRLQIEVLEAQKSNLAVEKTNLFLQQQLPTEQLKTHNIVVEVVAAEAEI